MARLSRPVATDTKYYKPQPWDPGFYKFQITGFFEWGSNKDMNIKGRMDKMLPDQQEQINVASIVWELKCIEAPYEGRTRRMWTTYWASAEKLADVHSGKLQKYLEKNPNATEEEAEDTVTPWRPQENLYEMLFAAGLMVKDEDSEEYKPVGWSLDNPFEAITAAVNNVIWGKIGPSADGTRQDDLLSVAPVDEV